MKTRPISAVVVLAIMALCAVCVSAGGKAAVLFIVREDSVDMELMLTQELGVMSSLVQQGGHTVVVATESGKEIRAGAAVLRPDLKISDARISDTPA